MKFFGVYKAISLSITFWAELDIVLHMKVAYDPRAFDRKNASFYSSNHNFNRGVIICEHAHNTQYSSLCFMKNLS